jgi:hypothetical protein
MIPVMPSIHGHDVTDQKKLVTTDEVTALTGRSRSKLYTVRPAGDFPWFAATCAKDVFCWVEQVAKTARMLSVERPASGSIVDGPTAANADNTTDPQTLVVSMAPTF